MDMIMHGGQGGSNGLASDAPVDNDDEEGGGAADDRARRLVVVRIGGEVALQPGMGILSGCDLFAGVQAPVAAA